MVCEGLVMVAHGVGVVFTYSLLPVSKVAIQGVGPNS